ncbi:hypothetical protein M0802_014442 [Mischocyttarus mexicanus]|nr:hypothetical protein M0802_014442 [Mischocyttarus mexicanus]
MTGLRKTWFWLKYADLGLVGLIIFYTSLKFKIVQTKAYWFIRKSCTMQFKHYFYSSGQNKCGQETVNRKVYFHKNLSRESITIDATLKTNEKKKSLRKYTSPVLNDLM